MTDLSGKVALVTGSSRGIGKAIAIELASRGAKVIVNYNSSEDAAQAVVDEIVANGGESVAIKADVSAEPEVEQLIKASIETFGQIDILVNNAGTTRDNVIMRMKAEDFDSVVNTNLRSTWLCSKAVTRPMMRQRSGRIINITSVSGIMGQSGQTNYSASKAGIIGFTKSLAREIASRGITVNAVAPGFVLTDMTKDLPDDLTAQLKDYIPLGRWGSVEDVAKAVAFLASDDAAYVTGHVLTVDGGMSM